MFPSIVFPASTKRVLIAYSGGLDSHVLLHLVGTSSNNTADEIIAIHVNHRLSDNADQWATHCRAICAGLNVSFRLVEIDATPPTGESPEAWARGLRYTALQKFVQQGDVLLTAHHMDDMAETLLIQLFRGAGPAGLASMPRITDFGKGRHFRPLLAYSRDQLHDYAQKNALVWIEDESNSVCRYDRNFLRNSLLPQIKQRWPAIAKTLSRAAKHQADASILLDDLASIDMQTCASQAGMYLSINALARLSGARAANLIRHWIASRGFSTPAERQLAQVFTDILPAKSDAEPCVTWKGAELRRYRDLLFIIAPLPELTDRPHVIPWDPVQSCVLKLGELSASRSNGVGISTDKCNSGRLTVRFRSGGEVISKGGHHHDLKNLFQQIGIPSCYRAYIPLLYIDDKLAAVAGLVIDEQYAAKPGEDSWQIHWTCTEQVSMAAEREGHERPAVT